MEQDERELERTPRRCGVASLLHFGDGVLDRQRRPLRALGGDLVTHPLVTHRAIHEAERLERLRVRLEKLKPRLEPGDDQTRLRNRFISDLGQVAGQVLSERRLFVEPFSVAVDERHERLIHAGQIKLHENPHSRLGLPGTARNGLCNVRCGQPRRLDRRGTAQGLTVGIESFGPVHRCGAADRELQAMPILQVEPLTLGVDLVIAVGKDVPRREEHRVATVGLDLQLGLEEPVPRRRVQCRHPVVRERKLDDRAIGAWVELDAKRDI